MKYLKILIFIYCFFYQERNIANDDLGKICRIETQKKLNGNITINLSIGLANIDPKAMKEFQQILKDDYKNSYFDKNKIFEILKMIYDNKFTITASILLTSYLYYFYKLIKLNNFINLKDNWSSYKSELPFEKLVLINQKELLPELLILIQKKYSEVNNNLSNKINVLVSFSNDIENELTQLKSYIKFINLIKFLHLNFMFKINENYITIAQEKINRLNYLKNIFSNTSINDLKQKENTLNAFAAAPAA